MSGGDMFCACGRADEKVVVNKRRNELLAGDDGTVKCGSKEYTKYTVRVGPVCHSGLHTRITFKTEVVWIDILFCPVDIFRRRSWCSGLSTTMARANLSTASTSTSLLTTPTSSTSGLADFAAEGRSSSSSDLSLSANHTTQRNTRVSAAWHYIIQSIAVVIYATCWTPTVTFTFATTIIHEIRNIPELYSLHDDSKSDSDELPDESSFSIPLSLNISATVKSRV